MLMEDANNVKMVMLSWWIIVVGKSRLSKIVKLHPNLTNA